MRPVRNRLALLSLSMIAAAPALAQGGDWRSGSHMWSGGWWMLLGPLWMIIVLAGIVAAVVMALRWAGVTGGSAGTGVRPTPLDILKERFARGEIDRAEFEERRKALE